MTRRRLLTMASVQRSSGKSVVELWFRRLTLPVAALIGGAIAIKPLAGLVTVAVSLSSLLPQELLSATTSLVPQAPMIVLGAMLLAACLLGLRALDD